LLVKGCQQVRSCKRTGRGLINDGRLVEPESRCGAGEGTCCSDVLSAIRMLLSDPICPRPRVLHRKDHGAQISEHHTRYEVASVSPARV